MAEYGFLCVVSPWRFPWDLLTHKPGHGCIKCI